MREIRLHGSVRGVRSNPHPYRDRGQPMPKAAQKTHVTPATQFGIGAATTGTAVSRQRQVGRNAKPVKLLIREAITDLKDLPSLAIS